MTGKKKAQISLEACLLIALCATASVVMYGYVKRAIQGSIRTSADSFSDEQYDQRGNNSSSITLDSNVERTIALKKY